MFVENAMAQSMCDVNARTKSTKKRKIYFLFFVVVVDVSTTQMRNEKLFVDGISTTWNVEREARGERCSVQFS